jgi:hypothetical protein
VAKQLNTKQMVSAIFEVGKILEAVDNSKAVPSGKPDSKPSQFKHLKDEER